jgi:glucose/arabinose dehydrogenase
VLRGCPRTGDLAVEGTVLSTVPRVLRGARRLMLAVGVLTLAGCDRRPAAPVRGVASSSAALPIPMGGARAIRVDTVARGLEVPWGLASLPDGRLLVTERTGRIRVIRDGVLDPTPWATVRVYANEPGIGPETGLLGLALAPDFATSGHVLVVATVWRSEGDRTRSLPTRLWRHALGIVDETATLRFANQVLRFTERDGRGVEPTIIVRELPAAYYHAGGALAFGPDGMLYVSMGDAMLPERAGRKTGWLGRIHRFTPDGDVPPDNPQPNSSTWAYGLRNAQGMVWTDGGAMVAIEHGPTGMAQEGARAGHDELNHIVPGADYGWPIAMGGESSVDSRPALWTWRAAIAPAGLAVYRGPISAWRGSVLVAGLRGRLERVVLEEHGDSIRVVASESLLTSSHGRLRTVHIDSTGVVYIATSNRDARGAAGPDDDLILRLIPASEGTAP